MIYKEIAKLINSLEVGSGEGYGIIELADKAQKYITDKYDSPIEKGLKEQKNIGFIK